MQIKAKKLFVAVFLLLSGMFVYSAVAEENPRFSVKDDIEVTQFGDVYFWIRGDVVTSPVGDKVLVHTVWAFLEDGEVHDELRVYATAQLLEFVNRSGAAQHVDPIWKIEESRADVGGDGPLISNLSWLHDETGVAFLLQTNRRHRSLCLAKLDARGVTELTSGQDNVLAFAIRNESHYVFAVSSRETRERILHALDAPYQVGTGRSFWDLTSPEQEVSYIERGDLWAANGGPPAPVKIATTGKPISLYEAGTQNLSLSPDGTKLVTVLPIANVPKQWESLYPPSYPAKIGSPESFGSNSSICVPVAPGPEYMAISDGPIGHPSPRWVDWTAGWGRVVLHAIGDSSARGADLSIHLLSNGRAITQPPPLWMSQHFIRTLSSPAIRRSTALSGSCIGQDEDSTNADRRLCQQFFVNGPLRPVAFGKHRTQGWNLTVFFSDG